MGKKKSKSQTGITRIFLFSFFILFFLILFFVSAQVIIKEPEKNLLGDVSIVSEPAEWQVTHASGTEGQLTFWTADAKDKKTELGFIIPSGEKCSDNQWKTTLNVYDNDGLAIKNSVDNKDIKPLTCKSAGCNGQDCYHISLTNAQSSNLQDLNYVKLGENSIIVEYQNEFFNVSINVTCNKAFCGTINVSLDPEPINTKSNQEDYHNFGNQNKLNYSLEKNKLKIDNDREFRFVIDDGIDKYEIGENSLSNNFKEGDKNTFSSKEVSKGLEIVQNISYYDDDTPMKIVHYLKNTNAKKISNPSFYYVFTVKDNDEIEIDGQECDGLGNCKIEDFVDRENVINFNNEYDFRYEDLIENGFTFEEFYFDHGELYVGFSRKELSLKKDIGIGESIELDPTFSTGYINAIDIAPLDDTSFVLGWCDAITHDITFRTYYVNGTAISSEIDADIEVGGCETSSNQVSVSAFNSTAFVIGWRDSWDDHVSFAIYDINGNVLVSEVDVDVSGGTEWTTSVSALNETAFVIGWLNVDEGEIQFAVYSVEGDIITSATGVDTVTTSRSVSVNALNSSVFGISYYISDNTDVNTRIYNSNGNALTGVLRVGNAGISNKISFINENKFVVAYFDDASDDVSFNIFYINGSSITGVIDIDSDAGDGNSVSVDKLNDTAFVISWHDQASTDYNYVIYSEDGSQIKGLTKVGEQAIMGQSSGSQEQATSIGLCNDNFVLAWAETTSEANWQGYYPNGTIWDGECAIADMDYPQFSNYEDNNNTLPGSGTGLFNVTVESTNGTVLLEINNTNYTASNLTLTGYNVSVPFTSYGNYEYKWHSWGNGTNENYNVSETRTYTIPSPEIGLDILTPRDFNGTNVTQNEFFNVEINISCNTANCGEINVSLYHNDSIVSGSSCDSSGTQTFSTPSTLESFEVNSSMIGCEFNITVIGAGGGLGDITNGGGNGGGTNFTIMPEELGYFYIIVGAGGGDEGVTGIQIGGGAEGGEGGGGGASAILFNSTTYDDEVLCIAGGGGGVGGASVGGLANGTGGSLNECGGDSVSVATKAYGGCIGVGGAGGDELASDGGNAGLAGNTGAYTGGSGYPLFRIGGGGSGSGGVGTCGGGGGGGGYGGGGGGDDCYEGAGGGGFLNLTITSNEVKTPGALGSVAINTEGQNGSVTIIWGGGGTESEIETFELVDLSLITPVNWWDGDYTKRKEINITGVGSLIDFPAYLNISYDSDIQSDWDDIRFINDSCESADTTELAYEIENSTGVNAHVWIKVPELNAGINKICMYYGNSSTISGENITGVWDDNYILVHHLQDGVNTSTTLDSTSNDNDGVKKGAGEPLESAGKIGNGQNSDGGDDYIDVGTDIVSTNTGTISAWVNADDTGQVSVISASDDDSGSNNLIDLQLSDQTGFRARVAIKTGDTLRDLFTGDTVLSTETWYYVTVVHNGTSKKIYVNDHLETLTVTGGTNSPDWFNNFTGTVAWQIGGRKFDNRTQSFDGYMDEARISNTNRSADWINQSYQIMANQDSFVTFEVEEDSSPVESGATPFNTNSSTNPITTSSLSAGESEVITFWVNATGELNSTHIFISEANLTTDLSIGNLSSKWNVTIVEPSAFSAYSETVELNLDSELNLNRRGDIFKYSELLMTPSLVLSRIYDAISTLIQSINIDLFLNRISGFISTLTQTIQIDNIVNRLATSLKTLTQTIQIENLVNRLTKSLTTLTQTINIENLVNRISSLTLKISQTIIFTITQTYETIGNYFQTLTQTIQIEDLINSFKGTLSTLTQTIQIDNIVNRLTTSFSTIVQTLQIQDFINNFKGTLSTLTQTIQIDNIVNRLATSLKTLTQTLQIQDFINNFKGTLSTLTQTIHIENLVNRLATSLKTLTQTIQIDNIVNRLATSLSTLTQTIQIDNLVNRLTTSLKTLTQTLQIQDFINNFKGTLSTLTQTIQIDNIVNRLTTSFSTITQTIQIDNIVNRLATSLKTLTQTIHIDNLVNRIQGSIINLQEVINIEPLLNILSSFGRLINQIIHILFSVTGIKEGINEAQITQDINFELSLNRIGNSFKDLSQIINLDTFTSRLRNVIIDIKQELNIEDNINRLVAFLRNIWQQIKIILGINVETTAIVIPPIGDGGGGGGGIIAYPNPKSVNIIYPVNWNRGEKVEVIIQPLNYSDSIFKARNITFDYLIRGIEIENITINDTGEVKAYFKIDDYTKLGNQTMNISVIDDRKVTKEIEFEVVETITNKIKRIIKEKDEDKKFALALLSIIFIIFLIICVIIFDIIIRKKRHK